MLTAITHTNPNLSKIADQCVMCGLCLPHCPTYAVSKHEGESPRGRISLVKAYALKEISASPAVQTHLQSCTGCLACERVCPANVPYHEILDTGRALYRHKLDVKTRIIHRFIPTLLASRAGHNTFRILITLAGLLAKFGVARISPLFHFAQLIARRSNKKRIILSRKVKSNVVTLWPGCTGKLFDQETLSSAIHVIETLDFQVNMPEKILCCGALAQHSGLINLAKKQQRKLRNWLRLPYSDPYISVASGCGQQLDKTFIGDSLNHWDIHHWLVKSTNVHKLKFNRLDQNVLVHIPCSMRYDSENVNAMLLLLQKIPDINIIPMDDGPECCGAGGMQLLTPENSNRALLQAKINDVKRHRPDVIVSANVGCALQLQAGLKQAKVNIEVIHPITLLRRQLYNTD